MTVTHETPLPDIARMLPTMAADALGKTSPGTQATVLELLRNTFVYWQSNGYTLDPVQFEGVVNSFIATMVPLVNVLTEMGASKS